MIPLADLPLPDYTLVQWGAVGIAFLLAGVIKGAIGFGVPIVVISILTLVLPVKDAIALVVVPAFAGNLLMMREGGRVREILARFWPLLLAKALCLGLGAVILASVPTDAILLVLGVVVVTVSLLSERLPRLHLRPGQEKVAGALLGAVTGLLAGTTTIFGPPVIMYMTALRLDRATYVAAIGTLWSVTNVMMLIAFGATDTLTLPLFIASLPLAPILLAGYPLGRWVRRRVDDRAFRRLIMAGLLVSGARLIVVAVV
ncbi:sulfite exporter TauE/SafE family protein [Roseospira navarrensis]|uniref:Probable membrane transporter protein n=1 Tax=Roseospira navarrensis TaxID=140058 RepID=A0A7X1ZB42_9PROT|nr:sulfite exporter TauE/SafE family protein [Roseospira navarrensis]MQX35263.1 TSUP family transporter [Roseospira navarrensis]